MVSLHTVAGYSLEWQLAYEETRGALVAADVTQCNSSRMETVGFLLTALLGGIARRFTLEMFARRLA